MLLSDRQSRAVGVGQAETTVTSDGLPVFSRFAWFKSGPPSESQTLAVGHAEEEDPFAFVARADFCRREQSALNAETQSL